MMEYIDSLFLFVFIQCLLSWSQDKVYSYDYVDRQATKVANLAISLGLKEKDTAAILMYNGPEFIWTFLGIHGTFSGKKYTLKLCCL